MTLLSRFYQLTTLEILKGQVGLRLVSRGKLGSVPTTFPSLKAMSPGLLGHSNVELVTSLSSHPSTGSTVRSSPWFALRFSKTLYLPLVPLT